ncbi:MAG: M18 family aminopeptidase, partial [Hydrogeniiclostridium sp.]
MDEIQSIFSFLNAGVSPWHAAAEAGRRLTEAGYERLDESQPWSLVPGGKYYVTRNGSAVLAFRLPHTPVASMRIALSHSDAPTWRIKNAGVEKAGCIRLEMEGYGGMIMSSWLDRPLTAAGRVVVRTENGVEARLVYADQDLLVIPSLAIHFDRGVNEGRKWDPQVDLQPVYGPAGCRPFPELLASEAGGCAVEDILAWDLCLVPRQRAVRVGPAGEFFMSPRIDDLECAGTTLAAFLEAGDGADAALVWGMLDNEEVGSSSRQGAQGTFLSDTLDRIFESLGQSRSDRCRAEAASLVLSADNGHAVHPNHPEKSDPENGPVMNGGVVVKVNASQKYTTDAVSAAL